jgi:ABC-type Fe3+/spermidine/putrescine transport system ATPase subunit
VGALQGRPLSTLLRITGLTVRYGATRALDALDLDVQRGELFVLLGASGSGKTTLLRAVGGFVRAEAGRIELDGTDLGPLPPHRRPVNTMFQSYALFPHMSVAANIGFGLRQQNVPRAAAAIRVAEMLDLVSLSGFGERRPAQLSGGQQQRVALARSLAPRPSLLLLDEPLSALDRNLRRETRAELVRLQRQLGIAFILVTHDQEEALTMATRIGVMRDGRLAQVGSPAEVYERPNSRFVAEFLGAANILPAPSDTSGHRWLAIRPERVIIGQSDAPNQRTGVVTERSYAGETLTHVVRLPDGTAMRATATVHNGLAAQHIDIGETVTLSWHPEACIPLTQ